MPLELLTQRVAFPESAVTEMPAFLREGAAPVPSSSFTRPVDGYLALAAALRVIPRISRWFRAEAATALRPQFESLPAAGEKLLLARSTSAADFLWHYWLLVLAQHRLNMPVEDSLLTGLWRRAWGTWERRPEPGPLHPPAADGNQDAVVFQDLIAIHAAYNAVILAQAHERLDPIERLVRWHVQNPPPSGTIVEPWALAAFACLDDTQTFAQRQMRDATTGPQPSSMTLGLLADALLSQEETTG
jgi:hypothetical protein